jgi:WD40 repeat protein
MHIYTVRTVIYIVLCLDQHLTVLDNPLISCFSLTQDDDDEEMHNYGISSLDIVMYLATGLSNNNIKLWSVESREHLATFVGEAPVTALCFSSDSCKLANGCKNGTVCLWDIVPIMAMCLDGPKSYEQDTMLLTIRVCSKRNMVNEVALNTTATRLAACYFDCECGVWDILDTENKDKNRLLYCVSGHRNYVCSLEWSHDEALLGTASMDSTVRLWNAGTGEKVHVFEDHEDEANCLAMDSCRPVIASGCADGTVVLWDYSRLLMRGRLICGSPVTAICFGSNNSSFANDVLYVATRSSLIAWNVDDKVKIFEHKYATPGVFYDTHLISIGPSNMLLAFGRNSFINFFGYNCGEDFSIPLDVHDGDWSFHVYSLACSLPRNVLL